MSITTLTAAARSMSDTAKTSTTAVKAPAAKPVKLKGVALPNEHGAWGMLAEPVVAALAVAFSIGGLWISLAVIAAFMMRQPLKVLMMSWRAGRRMPQTGAAGKFMAYYSAAFFAGVIGTLVFAPTLSLLPLVVAGPLAAVPIYFDAVGKSRKLAPELAGAFAITASAAVIALAGGWTLTAAAGLWAVLACRWIPSILYVRNRLLLEKGKTFSAVVPFIASAAAVIITGALAIYGISPWLIAAMMAVLTVRAAIGLSSYSKRRKAMQIGIFEVIYGAITVAAIVVGYRLGI